MGKSVSKSEKAARKARKKNARKRRLIRTGLIYFALLALCIGCLAMMPVINRAKVRENTWSMQNGGVELDADADSSDAIGIGDDVFDDDEDEVGEDGAIAITLDDVPSPASGEATPEPTEAPTPEPTEAPTPEPTAVPTDVSITITAAGDCTFGGCLKHDTYKVFKKYVDKYGYDYFFDKVRPIFQADDLTIINLEGPLTDVGTMTNKSSICFRGDPEWTAIMTGSSVELCNIANNHILDMGTEGAKRTVQALDEAGLGYCGYAMEYSTTIKGVRITALGFDKWTNKEDEVTYRVKKARENCDILIVNFHWGWEMHYEPMKEQKRMGHAIIDAGADLVIGTHPHVFGGVELYKGKYICYSLGNFCFGGNTMPSDQRAMMFQQTFVVSPQGSVSDGGINILPCLVSGNKKRNDFQPYVLGAKAGTTLLKKIARYSNLNKDTKWMPGSYPEQIGLIQANAAQAGAADAQAAEAQATLEPQVQMDTMQPMATSTAVPFSGVDPVDDQTASELAADADFPQWSSEDDAGEASNAGSDSVG